MKFFLFDFILCLIIFLATIFISKKTFFDKEKNSPFECGFDPFYNARIPFSLRFFKISLIFLIFDIEIVIILPTPFMENLFFMEKFVSLTTIIMIILMGLYFEWNQGSLEWSKT